MGKRERLDVLVVERGMAQSRERARSLIMAGRVSSNAGILDKPGMKMDASTSLHLAGVDIPYVSRGGLKLEGALERFRIDLAGKTVMDVGASTGGFTDCALQKGARKVYAVDVGHGQLAWKLQTDPRVVNLERRNIRYLPKEEVGEEVDLVVIDASFISIEKFLPHVIEFVRPGGEVLSLVKPQFEVGKGEVGKGGVVRNPDQHRSVIDRISAFSRSLGLAVLGVTESSLVGPKGNHEFFLLLRKDGNGQAVE
jgi:23S rRNA (cytidine1920-2'-O)/16S rRNA (cytidine1409-2'-O)-methyltransferase